MIKSNETISPYQIAMIVMMTIVGVGIFSLPSQLAETAGTDAWFIIPLGGIISIISMNIMILLNNRFPQQTLPEYAAKIIGKVPAKILTAIYALYFLVFIAYEARVLNEAVKIFLLFRTPSEVIMISIILVCTYAVRGGVECIGRVMELFFPLLFIPFLLILIPGIADVDLSNILPVFYDLPSKILVSLPKLALSYAGYELLLFYVGFMDKPKKAYLSATLALIFVTICYIIVVGLCLALFGENLLKNILWPLLAYVRTISLPGLFLERLDGVMLAIWVFTVFTTMSALYFVVTYSLSKILGTKEHKQFALPLVPVIYYIALLPENVAQIDKMTIYLFEYMGSILIFVIPPLLLFIAWIRKLRGESI